MIYVKQETEANFTALHVMPPDFGGLVKAIENKYKINGRCIRDLFKQSLRGHKVKMDDDMIAHYSNEAAFLMQVRLRFIQKICVETNVGDTLKKDEIPHTF